MRGSASRSRRRRRRKTRWGQFSASPRVDYPSSSFRIGAARGASGRSFYIPLYPANSAGRAAAQRRINAGATRVSTRCNAGALSCIQLVEAVGLQWSRPSQFRVNQFVRPRRHRIPADGAGGRRQVDAWSVSAGGCPGMRHVPPVTFFPSPARFTPRQSGGAPPPQTAAGRPGGAPRRPERPTGPPCGSRAPERSGSRPCCRASPPAARQSSRRARAG